jgi:hypothetical protein
LILEWRPEMEWRPIKTAPPFDRYLELAVIDGGGTHRVASPCRRVLRGWIEASTNEPVIIQPTHWREWNNAHPFSAHAVSA